MGKKYKKKVQWKQLSLTDILTPNAEENQGGDEYEEEEGDSAPQTPTHEDSSYPRPPYKPYFNNPRRGPHHYQQHGYYHANYDRRFDTNFDRFNNENFRNLENRGGVPFEKPYCNTKPFYDRNYHYDKFCPRPPFYGERNFKFVSGGGGGGFMERGRRPFRPYGGRPGFFSPRGFPGHFGGGPPFRDGHGKGSKSNGCDGEDEEEEWDDEGILVTEGHHHHYQIGEGSGSGGGSCERPSQPVHTVMINNEEYTKIQTPRQEVIFKKSSLDRKRDSIDQGSVTGSVSSGSGSSSCTGGEHASGIAGSGDQLPGDGSSVAGSVEDTSLSMTGDDPSDMQQQDQVFEDPNEIFAGEPGGPPLAGVVMQQAYPGGPMITIPVHWTPFINPGLIPGETALTPLDPAFTHVIDPKALPIDPLHILPVQHDASGCPVHVQVKVDSNGVPIQIQPAAFTVSLSSLHQHHHDQQGVLNGEDEQLQLQEDQEPHQQDIALHHQISSERESVEEEEEEEEGRVTSSDNQTEESSNQSSRRQSDGEEGLVEETEVSSEEGTTEEKSVELKDEENVNERLKDSIGENEEVIEDKDAVEEEEEDKDERNVVEEQKEEKHCLEDVEEERQEVPVNDERQKVPVNEERQEVPVTEEYTIDVSMTSAAVPSTNAEVMNSTESLSSDASRRRKVGGRGRRGQQQQLARSEEEEEEEEEMQVKESEDGSDSSDSQYASMSESSTAPTTPAGEPSESHEAPESHPGEGEELTAKEEEVAAEAGRTCKDHSECEDLEALPTSSGSPTPEDLNNTCDTQVEADGPVTSNDMETSQSSGISESEQIQPENITDYQPTSDATENILQGYVMVPILTPYYDPSVLYGCPIVIGDQNPQQHQRSYSKRKKKKYQRRRQADGGYLDPQLYTGEPFVATPGGYMVPVEAATSVCQVHGFQYVASPYQLHPDESFVQHLTYLPNVVPDPATQHVLLLGGTNQEDPSKTIFGDLQERERRQIQEILQEQRAKVGKSDSTESSDSGVSESEEVVTAELSSDELDSQKNVEEELASIEKTEATKDSIISAQYFEEIPDASIIEEVESLENFVHDDTATSNIIQNVEESVLNAQCEVPNEDIQSNQTCTSASHNNIDRNNLAIETTNTSIQSDIGSSPLSDVMYHNANTEAGLSDSAVSETNHSDQVLEDGTNINSLREPIESTSAANLAKDQLSTQQELENRLIAQAKEKSLEEIENIQGGAKSPERHLYLDENTSLSKVAAVTDACSNDIVSPRIHTHPQAAAPDKNIPEENSGSTIKDSPNNERSDESLGQKIVQEFKVTEAVKRWIREVTPEKAFLLSEEVQSRLLEQSIQEEMDTEDEYIEDEIPQTTQSTVENSKNVEGNPFVAASSNAQAVGMESCSKRVAVSNKLRGTTPDTLDDYDGSSTISNLSSDHLYSEASSSQPASFNQSFEEEDIDKHVGNPNIYNPVVYAKYYQLGVEVDDTTPSATPLPQNWQMSRETTPAVQTESETVSECGSEDVETVPHKYDVVCQYTATSPMSLATEILKAEKVLSNMRHITGTPSAAEASGDSYGNPDIFLKHYGTARSMEVGDSGVQSEESSDEMEARSNVGSSCVGSSLASSPALSPAHHFPARTPLQSHPLRNRSAGEGPVPCRTVCCAVM